MTDPAYYEDIPSDDEQEQEDRESEDVNDECEPEPYGSGYIGADDFDEDDADNAL